MLSRFFLLSLFAVFIFTGGIGAEEKSLDPDKPDLIVEKISIKKVRQTPSESFVEIIFTVKNASSVSTSRALTTEGRTKCPTGCFLVNLRADYFLEDKVVLKHFPEDKCKPLNGGESATFTFADKVVNKIKNVNYTVIVDSQNWIKESNETNNEMWKSLE